MQLEVNETERRRHPRTFSHTTAIVKTRRSLHDYVVSNLSVSGALLRGGDRLLEDMLVEVILQLPLYPEIRLSARVVRVRPGTVGDVEIAVHFLHESDFTEDHIQAALLSELERSQTHGIIPSLS